MKGKCDRGIVPFQDFDSPTFGRDSAGAENWTASPLPPNFG